MENMNWMQVEEYLKGDDRVILVMGSAEEHGYLTLGTDTQIPLEIAKEAAARTGVLIAPTVNYGAGKSNAAFPGTITIKPSTTMALVEDILESLAEQGFKRILILNGHGQNEIAKWVIEEISAKYPELNVKFRSWYMLPKAYEEIKAHTTSTFDHASWLENFPWINNCVPVPNKVRESATEQDFITYGPQKVRELMPEGVAGGPYTQDEQFMRKYYQATVDEVVELLDGDWRKAKM